MFELGLVQKYLQAILQSDCYSHFEVLFLMLGDHSR